MQTLGKKINFILLISSFILFNLVIIHPSTSVESEQSPTNIAVKVGYYESHPQVYKIDGKIAGIYYELLTYIAEQEGWTLEWIFGTWNESLTRLINNEIDIMTAIAFTEERAQIYDYNNETVISNWGMVYTHKDTRIDSILGLEDKVIAAVSNDIYYEGLKKLLEDFEINSSFILVDTYAEVFELIHDEIADCGISSRIFGILNEEQYDVKQTSILINPINLKFAFPKSAPINNMLIYALDNHLKELKDDKNSLYYQILDKYFLNQPERIVPKWVLYVFIIAFAVLLLSGVYVFILRRQVKIKSKSIIEKDELIKLVFEHSPAGIAVTTLKGKIIESNNQLFEFLPFIKTFDVKGLNFAEIFHKNDQEKIKNSFNKILEKKKLEPTELNIEGIDENIFQIVVSGSIIKDHLNENRYVMLLLQDNTERMSLLSKIMEKQKQIEFYSDILMHDIVNINQVIMSTLFVLKNKSVNSSFTDYLNKIENSVIKSNFLIENVKLLQQIENYPNASVNVLLILKQSIEKLEEITEINFNYNYNLEENDKVFANALLEQALVNVLYNSFYYNEKTKKSVRIDFRGHMVNDSHYELSIRDYGKGIEVHKLKDIIRSLDEVSKRTGLGFLFLMRVLERSEASFNIISRNDGFEIVMRFKTNV